jgi:hypothetical protein
MEPVFEPHRQNPKKTLDCESFEEEFTNHLDIYIYIYGIKPLISSTIYPMVIIYVAMGHSRRN